MSCSIIVPVYNDSENLQRCLAGFDALEIQPVEVIVVDDGSQDGSAEVARQYGAQVITLPQRIGPAGARNAGAAMARGSIFFFVDADVVVHPDALTQVEQSFRRRPGLTAVFGSYDDNPAAPNFLSQYKNLFHHYTHQTSCEKASTFWAGCGAIRRDVFLDYGGFDESYDQPSIEDIELGYRLHHAGHTIRLNRSLQGRHLKHWQASTLLRSDFFQRALPWTLLIMRDHHLINDLNLRVENRASVILVYLLLVTLVLAAWQPGWLLASLLLCLMLFALNAPLYGFLRHKRGLPFLLAAIPWHWCYYWYSGLAFVAGSLLHLFRVRTSPSWRSQAG